jgi:hypothetical protein
MFPLNGKVHYEKGFMSFNAFKKGLKDAQKRYGLNTLKTPMVFHFRIQSQGGVRADLTHPFPLTRSYDKMRELTGDVDVAVVHNGIIDFACSYGKVDYSDTMEFTKEVLYPLINKNEKYYENKALMQLVGYLLDGNRFIIMDKNGHVEKFGTFQEQDGVYYSNTSFKQKSWSSYGSYSLTGSGFKSTGSLLQPKLAKDYDCCTHTNPYWDCDYITKEMEKDFLETGIMKCKDCGGECVIEYIQEWDITVAYCYDCGQEYILTRTAEDFAFEIGCVICDYDGDNYSEQDDDQETKSWNASFGVNYNGGKC